MVCGRAFDSRALHHSPKANGSPLAFFFAGRRADVGVREGSCGLRGSAYRPVPTPVLLSPGGSSLLVDRVALDEVRKRQNFRP